MKIRTNFDPKPIPLRQFDWAAWDDDTLDCDSHMGWGETEDQAIADLQEKME